MRTLFTVTIALAVTIAALPAQNCQSSKTTPVSMKIAKKDIVDTAIAAGSFNTLVTAVKTANLVTALKGKGPFTVFAPSDPAFGKLPKGTVPALLTKEMRGRLTSILTWHVVPGRLTAKDVMKAGGFLETLNGQRLPVTMSGDDVMVGGARISTTDIDCSNGIIHVIDSVMLPAEKNIVATAAAAGQFKTLLTAATEAGLAPVLSGKGPFTILAPTDAAFAKLPAGTVESLLKPENRAKLQTILKYHVFTGRAYSNAVVKADKLTPLAGGDVRISVRDGKAYANDAQIVKTDIDGSNGVIHVIDSVLLPK